MSAKGQRSSAKTRTKPGWKGGKQRSSTPVDKIVGKRVRERRTILGWSQEELAERLKISFQQVQKYEAGTNRISASRLYQISKIMRTDANYFFGDLPMGGRRKTSELREPAKKIIAAGKTKEEQRAALALVRHYYQIQSPSLRRGLMQTVTAFAKQAEKERKPRAKSKAKSTGRKSKGKRKAVRRSTAKTKRRTTRR